MDDPNKTGSYEEQKKKMMIIHIPSCWKKVKAIHDETVYLVDKSNNLSSEPGKVKCTNVESIQHDHTAGWVIETLQ